MKNWQLVLTFIVCGGVFTLTIGGPNLLTPTISWTVGVLSLCGILQPKRGQTK
jgi:hypothetical protein